MRINGKQKHFTVQKFPDRLINRCLSVHMIVWMLHARMQFSQALLTRIPGPQTARAQVAWDPDLEIILVFFLGSCEVDARLPIF